MKLLITKIVPYKEKDAIISGFNESQNFSILCKGILNPKSRNAALNNPMTYAEIELSDTSKSKYDVLKSSNIIFTPMELIGDSQGLVMTMFISELVNKCLSEDEKCTLFKDILATLKNIRKKSFPRFNLLNLISKILNVAGFSFEVDGCQTCGTKKEIIGFSMEDGGFLCKECIKDPRHSNYSGDELVWIRRIFKNVTKDKVKLANDIEIHSFKKLLGMIITFVEDNFGLKLTNCELLID